MPKCMPIDTNQHNPTKIIDECQVIIEISTDKKTAVTKNAAMQYGRIEKEEVEFSACVTLWQGNLHKVAARYFLLFMYMVQCIKKIGQSCIVGLSGRNSPQYRADSYKYILKSGSSARLVLQDSGLTRPFTVHCSIKSGFSQHQSHVITPSAPT